MDAGTLFLVFVSELVILALFVWFVRHSNQRLMQEIVNLEGQLKQFNQFLAKLGKSHNKVKQQVSLLNSLTSDFGATPEKNGSLKEEAVDSRSKEAAAATVTVKNKK